MTFSNPGSAFENVTSFKGYVFSLPHKLKTGNTYIVYNYDNKYTEEEMKKYEVKHFKYYSVIDTTKERQK